MKREKFILVAALMLALAPGFSGMAHAIPCGVGNGFVNGGGADYACQDGGSGDNNDWNINLNAGAGFFGYTDWARLEKNDTPGGVDVDDFNVGLVVNPDSNVGSGTWSFTNSPWSTYSDIMIILKSGNHNGIYFSGYLVDLSDAGGFWDTGGKGLSHLSVYGRGMESAPVPEPATLMLLVTGLIGVGVFRKKFKA